MEKQDKIACMFTKFTIIKLSLMEFQDGYSCPTKCDKPHHLQHTVSKKLAALKL